MCEKYNGWSNYPTWCIKLWIDNDEGLQQEINQLAQDCYDKAEANSYRTKKELATRDFADELEDYIQTLDMEYHENVSGLLSDLLNWAIRIVDWYEIAKAIIDDEIEEDSE